MQELQAQYESQKEIAINQVASLEGNIAKLLAKLQSSSSQKINSGYEKRIQELTSERDELIDRVKTLEEFMMQKRPNFDDNRGFEIEDDWK